jgi:hypothetical protein
MLQTSMNLPIVSEENKKKTSASTTRYSGEDLNLGPSKYKVEVLSSRLQQQQQ